MGTKPKAKLPPPAPDLAKAHPSAESEDDAIERHVRMPRKVIFEQTVELDLAALPKWRPRRVISQSELRRLDD